MFYAEKVKNDQKWIQHGFESKSDGLWFIFTF